VGRAFPRAVNNFEPGSPESRPTKRPSHVINSICRGVKQPHQFRTTAIQQEFRLQFAQTAFFEIISRLVLPAASSAISLPRYGSCRPAGRSSVRDETGSTVESTIGDCQRESGLRRRPVFSAIKVLAMISAVCFARKNGLERIRSKDSSSFTIALTVVRRRFSPWR